MRAQSTLDMEVQDPPSHAHKAHADSHTKVGNTVKWKSEMCTFYACVYPSLSLSLSLSGCVHEWVSG